MMRSHTIARQHTVLTALIIGLAATQAHQLTPFHLDTYTLSIHSLGILFVLLWQRSLIYWFIGEGCGALIERHARKDGFTISDVSARGRECPRGGIETIQRSWTIGTEEDLDRCNSVDTAEVACVQDALNRASPAAQLHSSFSHCDIIIWTACRRAANILLAIESSPIDFHHLSGSQPAANNLR
jgi:hypothetical protein